MRSEEEIKKEIINLKAIKTDNQEIKNMVNTSVKALEWVIKGEE